MRLGEDEKVKAKGDAYCARPAHDSGSFTCIGVKKSSHGKNDF